MNLEQTRKAAYEAIDAAIIAAAEWIAFDDIDPDDEVALDNAIDERRHCGTCEINGVIELIWPPLKRYLDIIEAAAGLPPLQQ
jgi:hypothetical protein